MPEGPVVNGVRFDPLSPAQLLEAMEMFLVCGRGHVVHFYPGHPTVVARRDGVYRNIANRGDLNLVDGASVGLALRLFGVRAQRITGSDALALVPRWGLARGLRHGLFGGSPDVARRLSAELRRRFPGIEIVDVYSPPVAAAAALDIEAAADHMRRARVDVAWIGLGAPKQDFVAERLRELGAAPVVMCVGAAFDFLSGAKPRAPQWLRALGLEWAHRLASEPRRLWRRYLLGNPQFVADVLGDYVRGRASAPLASMRE
jgi:N-acetylglucosaminyldiphosphoundecaprenol N-acetyl-beta-D-mannosaminyltransferase